MEDALEIYNKMQASREALMKHKKLYKRYKGKWYSHRWLKWFFYKASCHKRKYKKLG